MPEQEISWHTKFVIAFKLIDFVVDLVFGDKSGAAGRKNGREDEEA